MIKRIVEKLLRYILHFKYAYKTIDFLGYQSRRAVKQYAEKKIIKIIAPGGSAKVLRGPFKGMIYPQMRASGSELIPKIIGSYESELHDVVELASRKKYAQIVDIGAAEGYYAVGFALRMPAVKVNVFETNQEAVELCKKMAAENQIGHQIIFKGSCNIDKLSQFEFTPSQKGLIICDCEGCELEILDPKRIPQLRYCDLLVEVHDFTATGTSSFEVINSRFSDTHKIKPINIKIRDSKNFPEFANLNDAEIDSILSERRIYSFGWMFMESQAH